MHLPELIYNCMNVVPAWCVCWNGWKWLEHTASTLTSFYCPLKKSSLILTWFSFFTFPCFKFDCRYLNSINAQFLKCYLLTLQNAIIERYLGKIKSMDSIFCWTLLIITFTTNLLQVVICWPSLAGIQTQDPDHDWNLCFTYLLYYELRDSFSSHQELSSSFDLRAEQ